MHPTQAWFDFFISTLNPLSFLPLFYFNTVGFMLEQAFNKIAKDTNSNNSIGDQNMNKRETFLSVQLQVACQGCRVLSSFCSTTPDHLL